MGADADDHGPGVAIQAKLALALFGKSLAGIRMLSAAGGAARVFGLLSLGEIPRRLSLDFSDIFRSGLSFNSITGTDGDSAVFPYTPQRSSDFYESNGDTIDNAYLNYGIIGWTPGMDTCATLGEPSGCNQFASPDDEGKVEAVFQKNLFFATLMCTAISTACLIAPTATHRLRFHQHDRRYVIDSANKLLIAGLVFLALAIILAVMLITDYLFDGAARWIWPGLIAVVTAVLWFIRPLLRSGSSGP